MSAPDLRTAEILSTLEVHLEEDYSSLTRQRGDAYARGGAVIATQVDGATITGSIIGSRRTPYIASLQFHADKWSADCTCPVAVLCKHAFALGQHWLDEQLSTPSGPNAASRLAPLSSAVPADSKPRETAMSFPKKSFREIWSPRLAQEIGRPLTEEENRLLGQLSAIFHQLGHHHQLTLYALHQHGLAAEPDTDFSHYSWKPAFPDWWTYETRPRDPWELWSYIALYWQQHGRPLPEAFASQTNLEPTRQRIEALAEQQEIDRWKRDFARTSSLISAQSNLPQKTLASTYRDLQLVIQPKDGAQLEALPTKGDKPWRVPTAQWLKHWTQARLSEFVEFPEPSRSLALALRLSYQNQYGEYPHQGFIDPDQLAVVLAHPVAVQACVFSDGSPVVIAAQPLQLHARPIPDDAKRLRLQLETPDGAEVPMDPPLVYTPTPLYYHERRLWRGPPLPASQFLPLAVLSDPQIAHRLNAIGLQLPAAIEAKFISVTLRPHVRCWTDSSPGSSRASPRFCLALSARSDDPPCHQSYIPSHDQDWQWDADGKPPPLTGDSLAYRFDLDTANQVVASLEQLKVTHSSWEQVWSRPASRNFVDDFLDWHADLPPETVVEVTPELRGLIDGPIHARVSPRIEPADSSNIDWFDVSLELDTGSLTFTDEEMRLLLKANGSWVRLPQRGWQRLQIDADETHASPLAKLGLAITPEELLSSSPQRYHALQLGDVPMANKDLAKSLRQRAAALRQIVPPSAPADLHATLRPYQTQGYHYLVHLTTQNLGGILADDMGLGKTVQTLAWLLWLRDQTQPPTRGARRTTKKTPPPFRVLIVCPKSVVPNWENETARFAPSLSTARLPPRCPVPMDSTLLVINYTQLRLRAADLGKTEWNAVILDEGQNIKNPASATAKAAIKLKAAHRVVLTGTPIENRLLDLWSLLAFAQPGLMGNQASFKKLYHEKDDPTGARDRLAARVRPFMLRRTKREVARDLPDRAEEDISCELDGPQRTLYDAELKRARQMLLGVADEKAFHAARFNILQSLLRLRQICCDPRLVTTSSQITSSAKLDALLDTLEPLVAEGHRVLVFSQFVGMLEIIRAELNSRHIGHLLLTGQTENRQEMVDTFQSRNGPPVFLLSLKAAGVGLNLTAASYVVLYDPWWNPAVEAQAIDRTHRIGQTAKVIAYRLIAKDTVEEKIRKLQAEKSALAAAVVREENLAKVMDLKTLREVLC